MKKICVAVGIVLGVLAVKAIVFVFGGVADDIAMDLAEDIGNGVDL